MAYKSISVWYILLTLLLPVLCFRTYTKEDILRLREEVRDMFQHAYEGYLKYAGNYDELRPLSCDGVDTWGSYSLTLIDALDTLAVMGNYSEFRRVVDILTQKTNFDADINVSVFETNIRIVGGLLGAHLMSLRAGVEVEPGWPCNGPLLRLAEDVAKRLLPAFDTKTGMPYGTVNLRHGVPPGETTVTCTAGVGTFIVEFGALSRLTGDPIYEEVALNALYALWKHRSPIGLFGNHIDVQSGRWTAQDAGIGAGVDSYYEYLVKGALMLNRPELLEMFHTGRKAIDKYLKRDDWHVWVSMNKGQVTLPVFQSLEAYWPGVLSLIGDIGPAMKTLHNYHSVWKQYGFLPEFYNIPSAEAGANRENYPLRPELIESVMYLYRATSDPYLLEVGEDMLRSIQYSAKTSCGYATIKNVRDHRKEDRMESFFLAETTKYLYLLFDPENFLHNDGREGTLHETPNGVCVIHAGGYIFNTEAHPIDPSALRCCHENSDWLKDYSAEKFLGEELKIKEYNDEMSRCTEDVPNVQNIENLTIEIEAPTMDMDLSRQKMVAEIMNVLKALENESSNDIRKEKESTANASEDFSETSNVGTYGATLKEAVAVEKAFETIITTFKPFIKLHEKVIDSESKLTDLMTIFETIVNDYLIKNNITREDLLNNYDRTLIDKEAKANQAPLKRWITNEERMTFIKFLVDTFKELHSLQKQSQQTSPENIAKQAKDLLDSLKTGTDESILKRKYPKIMDIFKTSQANYEKLRAKKNLIVDILTYSSQLQSPPGPEEIDMKKIASIIEIIKEKRQNFENSFKRIKSDSLNLKLFGELYNMLPRIGEINETMKNIARTLVGKASTESAKSAQNDDIILVDETNKNLSESNLDSKTTDENLQKEQDEKSAQISDMSHEEDYGPDVGKGSVEPVNLKDVSESLSKSDSKPLDEPVAKTASKQIIQPSVQPAVQPDIDDIKNNSLLTDFLQTILKSTLPAKPKFEPQLLLEKIRENGIYNNQPQHFELLTCRAQPFLQRVSINGEFF